MSVLVNNRMLRALGLVWVALGVMAAPALAAPSWEVSLTNHPTELPRTDERIVFEAVATNVGDTPTSGEVTVTIELPGGEETTPFRIRGPLPISEEETLSEHADFGLPNGWDCSKQLATALLHASVTCTRSDALSPGEDYPPIVIATHLGSDAESPVGTAQATVSGGAAASASDSASYTFTPGLSFGILEGSFSAKVSAVPDGMPFEYKGGWAPAATIASVGSDTLELSTEAVDSGRQLLSAGSQPFEVGQEISGSGIAPGTTIEAIGPGTLTLSARTSKAAQRVAISSGSITGTAMTTLGRELLEVVTATGQGTMTAGSKIVTDVSTESGDFMVGQSLVGIGIDHTKAGGHPFSAGTAFGLNVHHVDNNEVTALESIKDTVVDAPRGFVGNALATPEFCDTVEAVILGSCPAESSVGGINVYTTGIEAPPYDSYVATGPFGGKRVIYSLTPEYGQPAQFAFGFFIGFVPYTFVPELRADEGYAVSFRTAPIVTTPELVGAQVTLCNFGANIESLGGINGYGLTSCRKPTAPDAYPHPLITNPTRCSGPPPATGLKVDSWQHPGDIKTADFSAPQITECDAVLFEPEAKLEPTNHQADTPTGLAVEMKMPIEGVQDPSGVSQANLDTVTVTFPKGMTINGAAADGLGACSLAQVKLHSNAPDECPASSRVGQIEIDTPLIRETLKGSIYLAKQNDNPFNSTIGLYMVFDSPRDGVRIKVAGKVTPDPQTGQLVSTFTENPEAPFSRLALHFNEGPRAPLVNPPKCGTYAIHAEFSPWSAVNPANPTPDEIVEDDSAYEVTSGPGGSPCPDGALEPKLKAGVKDTQAGSKSPFVFSLSREDGTQRFSKVGVTTPRGLTAYLKGIPYCPDAVLAGISAAEGAGASELSSSACPGASQVGTAQASAGAGPVPFYASGRVFLAGPYKGAPLSLAVVTPAVAGPFDLGNVVVRNPLFVDPVTAQVSTESDPIPTALHGITLDVRDIRVNLDRPAFTQAPTNCEPMAVDAMVKGEEGATANVSSRFQVGGCEKLGFKPKLSFRLFGGTHRGSHPRLRATVKMPTGGANIASASVALPHSEFLDQAHIKTVCTRVQFAADACPPGSIYGEAEATSPLVDYTLKGPVYLRSSDHQLPDMVVALRGPASQPIEIDLAGRIDSVNGGIRSTFESVPDQPVSSFTLNMRGGRKGLLVNSRNICTSTQKATAVFNAQNGKSAKLRPVLKNACKKSVRKGKKSKGAKQGKRRSAR